MKRSGKSHPYSFDPQDFTDSLKVHKAWFVVGYPKGNLLPSRITGDSALLVWAKDDKEAEERAWHWIQRHGLRMWVKSILSDWMPGDEIALLGKARVKS